MAVSSGNVSTNVISKSHFYANWSQTSQSTANNSTTINWSAGLYTGTSSSHDYFGKNAIKISEVYINGVLVSNGGTWSNINTGGSHDLLSGSAVIPHNADGTKTFSVSIKGWTYSSSNYSGSGSFELTAIPRQATISTATNFNDEQNPTITYVNGAGNNVSSLQVCIALTESSAQDNPAVAYRDVSKTGTSYTFNLTDAERTALRNGTSGQNRNVWFFIKTILNGTTYYSYKIAQLSIVNANPTIDTITYADINATTTAFTNNDQVIIQGLSRLQFQMYDVEALKGATLSSLSVNVNGTITTTAFSGTSIASTTYNFNEVDVAENTTAVLTLTDSRGFSSTFNVPITIWAYEQPTAIINVGRQNNFYTESIINVDANYSSLNSLNTIAIKFRKKKSSEQSYGAWATIQDNTDTNFNADNQFAWDLQVHVEDALGGFHDYTLLKALDVGIPIVFYDMQKRSVGINCLPTQTGELEVNGLTMLDMAHPVGSVLTTRESTNPSSSLGGTWSQIECNAIVDSGNITDTNINFCYYKIYANGTYEIYGITKSYNVNATSSHTITFSLPFTSVSMVCDVGISFGGTNYSYVQSYGYGTTTGINLYSFNNSGGQAQNVELAFICRGIISLTSNNITPMYSWERTA